MFHLTEGKHQLLTPSVDYFLLASFLYLQHCTIQCFLAASPLQTSHTPLTGKWGPHSRSSKKLPKKKRDHALVLQTPTMFSGLTWGVFSGSTGPWNQLFTLIGGLHGHTFLSMLRGGGGQFRDCHEGICGDFMAISLFFTLGGFTVIWGFHGHLKVFQKYPCTSLQATQRRL